MNTTIRSVLLAGGVLTLASCGIVQPEVLDTHRIDPQFAKNAPDQGTPFQRALHQTYSSFGQWEYDQADFASAGRYNDRAQLSADGSRVNPDDLSVRKLAPQPRSDLVAARAGLMTSLDDQGTLDRVPTSAARAQVFFDCWAEQQEEGHQPAHIAYCRDGFESAMVQLTPPVPAAQAPAPATPMAQAAPARPYLVFFDWDRSALTASSSTTVEEIATALRSDRELKVSIAGHADKSGRGGYNDALSQRRAEAVMSALSNDGVLRSRATVESFGEARPLVDTMDNVREPQNRRVELIVR